MTLLFVHDHKFRYEKGIFYSTGGLSDEVLQRYTRIFGKVNIIARVVQKKDEELSQIENKNVSIFGTSLFLSDKKLIQDKVKESDYIIVRLPSVLGGKVIKYAQKHRKPYLVELVACPWDALWNHSVKGKAVAPFAFLKTKQLVKNAPFTLYVTNEFLQKRYPSLGKSIGCSDVNISEMDKEVLNIRCEKIENYNKKIILGTIASVDVKYKGQGYVIKAIAKLKKEGYYIEYQLVGGGKGEYLINLAKSLGVEKQIKLLGSLPHNDVFSWIDTIDIYVQPSKQEGLPRALIEAMSRGCPAIGSSIGGIPELLREDRRFSAGDVNEICALLKKMIEKNVFAKDAVENFEIAQKYNESILNKRRESFYKFFKERYLE